MSRPTEPKPRGEQRRGEELRRHILFVAKDVFLESGYERASMDTVAARAGTSKRSLYAHFESKDRLFLAVLDLVHELYLGRLGTPGDYSDDPAEAVVLFCGRFLQLMVWEPQVRTCRLSIAEAERLPENARAYFDTIHGSTRDLLTTYVTDHFGTAPQDAAALADDLLGRCVLPRLFRTLLGVEAPLRGMPEPADLARDVDLDAVRGTVTAALQD
ncbi:TetR/AcrR family transcriptional regulator [Actinacidiphila rubida]|uniref:Transcriptional regulator, TetR family n=1 Tax=Actinacidiphila rubida TaxID=310780 RepID=A0A1H8UFN3_9ACTN|nr:TetR/AcrR family transcriptional regulator [Actinacidiphila rubida]SEP01837.1 transcriptional regulator, TetR family [Actinacidiphila rubida]